jgi:HAD superfamily hydrolase (TIGR01509 family)
VDVVPGLCFDLDGVLWDTWDTHGGAFVDICHNEGLRSVPYESLAGRTTVDAWRFILAGNGLPAEPERIARLTADKQRLARERLRSDPPLYDDLRSLTALARMAVPTALISGSSAATVEIFLGATSAIHRFDVVITAESVTRGKPAPDPYIAAAASLGLEPSRCWVLEDSISGLQSGLTANMRTVHLARKGRCDMHHPGVVGCVHDLVGFLEFVGVDSPAEIGEAS